MGNQQQYGKSVETFILKYLLQLNYKKTLNDTLLYKTVLCTLEDEGPIMCKFHFSRIDSEFFKYLENEMDKIRKVFDLHRHPNILVFDKIFNIQGKAIVGVRQYVCHNLKEKLHRIPRLSKIEKKWLVFQLLCAISQIHNEKMVHGDIKPSNIVLTSYNWLFLTDQVYYKPSNLGEDDLKQYNLYFGELDNNLRCYIAPERFQSDFNEDQMFAANDPAVDIFSAGCVIAEIFMDGHPLFDLANLQNYRKKVYDPREDMMKKIKDQKIVDLIMSMIHRDPYKRAPISEYILRWNKEVLPRSFNQVYFQLASTYVRPQFLYSDMKISLIRKYIDSIWFSCFNKRNASQTEGFNEPIEPFVFERIREDTIRDFEAYLVPSNELFVFLSKQNLQAMYDSIPEGSYESSQDDKDSIIIVVHQIGTLITSCFYPQSRTLGLEMLYKMALESSIDIRLQFILPYVLQMFEDENSKVKAKAIEVAVMMFADVLDKAQLTTLTATDYKVFDNYIFPAFLKLKNESRKDSYIQHVFVRYLPMLAQIGHRFLELSIGSRFQKRQIAKTQGASQNANLEESKGSENSSSVATNAQDSDDENERLFSQSEALLSSFNNQPRSTIVIRDNQQNQEKQKEKHHHDAHEVFVNYDTEYDKLRRIILGLINDILSESEPSLQRMVYDNLGTLSVFFGRKMTIDNLIPLSNSCFNKKDFMLRMECLRGIPYLGLRVGQQTLAKYLLVTCTHLLYDAEELVVNEMIKTLCKLLEFGLLSKADSLENLEKLMPYLLYPNCWIREGVIKFIKFLADPKNKILTKAEVYCLIRPKLKQYLRKGEKLFEITDSDLSQSKLKPYLSRTIYTAELKGTKVPDTQLTQADAEARKLLIEVISSTKMFHQSFKREKTVRHDVEAEYQQEREKAKTYRLIPSTYVAQIAGVAYGNAMPGIGANATENQKKNTSSDSNDNNYQYKIDQEINEHDMLANDLRDQMSQQEYLDQHYYPMTIMSMQDVDKENYGLNKRVLSNSTNGTFEFDSIMQALNFVPEDPEIALIQYKNPHLFQHLAVQGIPIGAQIQVEQASQQPQQVPQFDKMSKTIAVNVNQTASMYYSLGAQRHKFPSWRPSGRLITTLFEHKNAVNSLAITDDSSYFFTGSKLDNNINIWKTRDIESDVTSHSAFSLRCKRQVNSITTIDNSNYFAVASSQGCIDIYQMGRVEQEFQHKISERRQASVQGGLRGPKLEKNPSIVKMGLQQEPNHTSIVKTIEKKEEGDIILCTNMILPLQQQHLLAYLTQKGSLYFHDLRSRYDVSSQYELFGCQRGMGTCMTVGQDPYQLYFGTVGGYVMIYDVRYNVVSSYEKHFSKVPINSVAAFAPGKSSLNFNRSDCTSPMMLISAGSANYEVSLLNLETSNVEVLLSVDDRKTKDNLALGIPQVPSYYKETNGYYEGSDLILKKYETNNSLFRRYLQTNRNSQHFLGLISLQQQQLIRNLDEEWLKSSKNRYMMVKTNFESNNSCRKILVPRRYNSMLHNPETVSYAITGGNDKKIRYWDFTNLKKKSFTINSPQDDECQYLEEYQGDTLVVQEKVNQFKQFPPITNQLAGKQFEQLIQPSNNYVPYANSTYYGIVGGLMNQQSNESQSIYHSLKNSSFQQDKVNDQDVILNFNGLSEWQHFNGVSMNQGCGTVGAGDVAGGLDYHFRDSQNISHSDCILDMGMLELSNQEPILVTCGRDGLVKLWR